MLDAAGVGMYERRGPVGQAHGHKLTADARGLERESERHGRGRQRQMDVGDGDGDGRIKVTKQTVASARCLCNRCAYVYKCV